MRAPRARRGRGGSPTTRSPAPAATPPTGHYAAPAAVRNGRGATISPSGGGQCRSATARSWRVTISRNPAKRPAGSVPASNASHARSATSAVNEPRPLAQGHRELMAQHQDRRPSPRLPPRQAQHRHGRVTTRNISFKPTSRRSSTPARTRPAARHARVTAPTAPQCICQLAQVFGTDRYYDPSDSRCPPDDFTIGLYIRSLPDEGQADGSLLSGPDHAHVPPSVPRKNRQVITGTRPDGRGLRVT